MISTACAICGSKGNFKVLYPANFSEDDLNKEIFSARRLPDGSHYQMVQCLSDGLVRSNPVIDAAKLASLYKESSFNYAPETENLEKTYLNALKEVLAKISKEDKILEIGCGNGFVLTKLYEMGFKNVYGIEPSTEAVSKADERIKKNIKVDILKSGLFKKDQFKLIFFFQTLDHIPNPNEFLQECYKILAPGGYILAFNHNVEALSAKVLGEKSPIIDIEHTFLYSPKTIKMLFERNKFQPLKIYSPANTISLKHLVWLTPIPKSAKKILLEKSNHLNKINLQLKLGNICIIATK